jgi:hypothetical protein
MQSRFARYRFFRRWLARKNRAFLTAELASEFSCPALDKSGKIAYT